ncbi:hypothetical protein KI387_032169, partial [Taxus chinensis]
MPLTDYMELEKTKKGKESGEEQERDHLEDMWKEAELAFRKSRLYSDNKMKDSKLEAFCGFEMDIYNKYCNGQHVFVIDEEIG